MRYFLTTSAALLLSVAAGLGQAAPAKPAVTPRPTPFPRPPFASDNSLMESGAFEAPRVTKRLPKDQGGNPVPYSQGEWVRFEGNAATKDGTLVAGLTNEAARTGRQSLYVEFKHQTARNALIELDSRLVRIKPGATYHVAIWGRSDAKNPITIDQRLPFLRVEVDFFQADELTQTGASTLRTQPIPGAADQPPLFPTTRWGEFYVDAKAPDDAAFVKIAWVWMSAPQKGETTGVAYFDDATIEGEKPPPLPEPAPAEEAAPAKPDDAASAPAATPAPATPAAGKRRKPSGQ